MIGSLGDYGVEAEVIDGLTGVWVGGGPPQGRKIGSIGVHVSRGVTTHGFAVNVNNDLQPFEWVVPCGIEGCRMTSLCRELGAEQDMAPAWTWWPSASARSTSAEPVDTSRSAGRAARRAAPGTVVAMANTGPTRRADCHVTRSRANPGGHAPTTRARSPSARASRPGSRCRRRAGPPTAG